MKVTFFANGKWVEIPHDGRIVVEISDEQQKFTLSEDNLKLSVYSNHCRPTIEILGNTVEVEDRYVGRIQ